MLIPPINILLLAMIVINFMKYVFIVVCADGSSVDLLGNKQLCYSEDYFQLNRTSLFSGGTE